jgi:hypothetical protein
MHAPILRLLNALAPPLYTLINTRIESRVEFPTFSENSIHLF